VYKTALLIVCVLALGATSQASVISIVPTRASFTETDFIDWLTVATNVPNSINSPVNSTTNGGVSFSLAQSNTNPLNCQTGGGCLRYDNIGIAPWTVHGFDTFSPMTLSFGGSGFGIIGLDGVATRSTTFFLQVTHGGVQDAPIQFSPNGTDVFLGVQSTANDITQVILSISGTGFNGILNGDFLGMDRVSLGQNNAAAVPEPATFGMMLSGVAAVALAARRRKKA